MRPLKRMRAGLLVLVRNGRDGARLARVFRTSPLVIQKWMSGRRGGAPHWGATRTIPERDVLGLPDKDDARVRAAKEATT